MENAGKKRIYISGKITGDPGYREKFKKEEDRLASMGYRPVNPAAIELAAHSWQFAMRVVLRSLLSCDGVSLLPGWRGSKGAKIERRLALEVGLDVREAGEWAA